MVTLEQILEHLETHCGLTAADTCNRKQDICQVELKNAYTHYRTETVYLDPEAHPCALHLWDGESLSFVMLSGEISADQLYRVIRDLLDSGSAGGIVTNFNFAER